VRYPETADRLVLIGPTLDLRSCVAAAPQAWLDQLVP
jgi:hypothetical protein